MSKPKPLAQITISVVGTTLQYSQSTVVPPGGTVISPVGASGKRHKIQKGTQIQWFCAQDFAVLFPKSPFGASPLTLTAPGGTATPPQSATKKGKKFKYTAAVAVGGSAPILIEDPELDVSDDGGGDLKAKKKASSKKKKK